MKNMVNLQKDGAMQRTKSKHSNDAMMKFKALILLSFLLSGNLLHAQEGIYHVACAADEKEDSRCQIPNNKSMDEKKDPTGAFVASVLLSQNEWDINKIISDCKSDWNIDIPYDNNAETLVAFMGDITLAVAIMPVPVPNHEAEHYARANYMWKDAVEMTKSHKAHILVSVVGKDADLLEKGKLFTKVVSSCLKQKGAIAVYTDGAVFESRFYRDVASVMHQDDDVLPILDWVWFGVYHTEEYAGIYTYGMRKLGKEEMEVYAENADLNDIRDFLLDIVTYVLDCDVVLKDGETIGFSEDQKLDITLSDAIAIEGKSLKIKYPK